MMNMNEPDPQRTLDASINTALPKGERVPSQLSFVGSLIRSVQARSIEQRVLAGFGLVFAGILVISVISYRNMTVLIRNGHQDQRSHEFIQLLGAMGEALDDAENGHRRFLVTGDESYLAAYNTLRDRAPEFTRYLRELTDPDSSQGAHVTHLEQLITQQLQQERNAIEVRNKTGYESVRDMALTGVAKASLDAARKLQGLMEQEENKALAQRVIESTRTTLSLSM